RGHHAKITWDLSRLPGSVMGRRVQVREVQEHYALWELQKPEHVDLRPSESLSTLPQRELENLIGTLAAGRRNSMHNMLVAATLEWEETTFPLTDLFVLGVSPGVAPVIRQAGGKISELARI